MKKQLELLSKEKDRNWGDVESAGTCQPQNGWVDRYTIKNSHQVLITYSKWESGKGLE